MSISAIIPNLEEKNLGALDKATVSQATASFRVFRNLLLREVFRFFPVFLATLLVLDWSVFQGQLILTNLPRLTSAGSFAIGVLLYLRLYGKVPDALKTLWDRRVLFGDDNHPVGAEAYVKFLKTFEDALNAHAGVLFGFLVLAAAAILLFRERVVSGADTWIGTAILIILASVSWFLTGIGFWRLMVITFKLRELSHRFKIRVQPAHPDKSGGLQPLGDLCLANALTVLFPIIYVVSWIVLFSSPSFVASYPQIASQLRDYEPMYRLGFFQIGLIFLLASELVIFFWPILDAHREMVRQRVQYQERLDRLAKEIDDNTQLLLDPWKQEDLKTVQQLLETRQSMLQVYQDNREFPLWPFDRLTRLKLTSAQVLPLLSVVGAGKPILDLVAAFLAYLQQP